MTPSRSEQVEWEDWIQVAEPGLRKRIQNRMSQRRHRERKRLQNQSVHLELGSAAASDPTATVDSGANEVAAVPRGVAATVTNRKYTSRCLTQPDAHDASDSQTSTLDSNKELNLPEFDPQLSIDDLLDGATYPETISPRMPGDETSTALSSQDYVPMDCHLSGPVSSPIPFLFDSENVKSSMGSVVGIDQGSYTPPSQVPADPWRAPQGQCRSFCELGNWCSSRHSTNPNSTRTVPKVHQATPHSTLHPAGIESRACMNCGCHVYHNREDLNQLHRIIQESPALSELARQSNVTIKLGVPSQTDRRGFPRLSSARVGPPSPPLTTDTRYYLDENSEDQQRVIVVSALFFRNCKFRLDFELASRHI
ncbi:hypothetical protein DTO207G8_5002 [Paecilomyces variotii]|nr:hypothetical protein DTO207G8_5002 [Paecilomyces variotii]KAJ9257176.1 hypothetical protein DTO212C5_8929 [Paecilomyces variotii]